jgi:hypothetical protein
MPSGRPAGVVVQTIALMIVRRVLGVLGCGPTPNADAVEIAVLRHQLAVLHRQVTPPAIHTGRLDAAGRLGEAAATRAVGGLPGHARDAAALAAVVDRSAMKYRCIGRDPRRRMRSLSRWWSDWRGRTRAGGICGSWGSAAVSACGCRRPRARGPPAKPDSVKAEQDRLAGAATELGVECPPGSPGQVDCRRRDNAGDRWTLAAVVHLGSAGPEVAPVGGRVPSGRVAVLVHKPTQGAAGWVKVKTRRTEEMIIGGVTGSPHGGGPRASVGRTGPRLHQPTGLRRVARPHRAAQPPHSCVAEEPLHNWWRCRWREPGRHSPPKWCGRSGR